jgi:hypothetical protein
MSNIIDFAEAWLKAKQENLSDTIAEMTRYGWDPAKINALYSAHIASEKKQAPDIACRRKVLKDLRKTITAMQKVVASADDRVAEIRAHLPTAIETANGLEKEIIIAQYVYLDSVVSPRRGSQT